MTESRAHILARFVVVLSVVSSVSVFAIATPASASDEANWIYGSSCNIASVACFGALVSTKTPVWSPTQETRTSVMTTIYTTVVHRVAG
jgi:hypothetical protein